MGKTSLAQDHVLVFPSPPNDSNKKFRKKGRDLSKGLRRRNYRVKAAFQSKKISVLFLCIFCTSVINIIILNTEKKSMENEESLK